MAVFQLGGYFSVRPRVELLRVFQPVVLTETFRLVDVFVLAGKFTFSEELVFSSVFEFNAVLFRVSAYMAPATTITRATVNMIQCMVLVGFLGSGPSVG